MIVIVRFTIKFFDDAINCSSARVQGLAFARFLYEISVVGLRRFVGLYGDAETLSSCTPHLNHKALRP